MQPKATHDILYAIPMQRKFTHHLLYANIAGSGNLEVSSKAEQGVNSLGDVPWNVFRKSKALWGLISVHCSFGVGPLVCLSWLPSYYSDVSLIA